MNFSSPVTQNVLLVVFGVLVTASVIGFILSKTVKSESGRATVSNLVSRVNSWWVMVIVLFAALAMGRGGATVMFALIAFLALREFLTATPTRRADHISLFVSFFVILPYQFWLVYTSWYGMFTILVPVYAFVLIPMLTALAGDVTDFLERNART
jgi:phosphatidate cytidylyltransferase